MTLNVLLIALRALPLRLYAEGDKLRVSAPDGACTSQLKQALRDHKPMLLTLPKPYINDAGDLVIPLDAPPQYHWQPLRETLRELNASPEVWRRYTSKPYPEWRDDREQEPHERQIA